MLVASVYLVIKGASEDWGLQPACNKHISFSTSDMPWIETAISLVALSIAGGVHALVVWGVEEIKGPEECVLISPLLFTVVQLVESVRKPIGSVFTLLVSPPEQSARSAFSLRYGGRWWACYSWWHGSPLQNALSIRKRSSFSILASQRGV